MPNSLKVQIKKLAHDGKIDSEECDALLKKLEGHDEKLKQSIIEDLNKQQANNILLQVMKNNPEEFAYVLDRTLEISKKNHYVSQCDPVMCSMYQSCVGWTEEGCQMYEWILDQLASIDIPKTS